jgi:hypothetical protein
MQPKNFWLTLSFVLGIVLLANCQTTTKPGSSKASTKTSMVVGKWMGSYSGSASGKCEMEFTQDASGKTTGQVAIQPEGGEKSSFFPFDSVTLEGNNLKASFRDPDGEVTELVGKLDNNQLKGTWKSGQDASGIWQTDKSK